jgi:general stress protein 26
MADKQEFRDKLWKALKSDMTVMLEADGIDARPMTAQVDDEPGSIWFFTSSDTEMGKGLARAKKARISFASKGHDLFAHLHGSLRIDRDQAQIDRHWNRFVAAWFEGGKDDPKVTLLRFDPEHAEVWKDASSLVAGVKMLLGLGDPKKDYKDSVAEVSLPGKKVA